MLKINSSFSKKIPVPGVEMSSQSYHATIEAELPGGLTAQQVEEKIHETFELVRESVEAELRGDAGNKSSGSLPATNNGNDGGNGSNGKKTGGRPASQKQLKYLRDLGARKGYNTGDLDSLAKERFGAEGLKNLTGRQASELIDRLNGTIGEDTQRRAA